MVSFFYGMMRCLRMRPALEATIHSSAFLALNPNKRVAHTVADIKNVAVWKTLYTVTKTGYPVICILCYCNTTVPYTDKLYFFAFRATEGIKKTR
jgi:hypothetical protein